MAQTSVLNPSLATTPVFRLSRESALQLCSNDTDTDLAGNC